MKVVLYDVDGTLISQASLSKDIKSRPLFFPETTKAVFEKHKALGDYIIISSSATQKKVIEFSLAIAGIKIDWINEILGAEETKALPGDTTDIKKVNKARQIMESKHFELSVIVEDSVMINSNDPKIVHILVPTDAPENKPFTDSYLKLALLPAETLNNKIKPLVSQITQSLNPDFDSIILGKNYEKILNAANKKGFWPNFFKYFFAQTNPAENTTAFKINP